MISADGDGGIDARRPRVRRILAQDEIGVYSVILRYLFFRFVELGDDGAAFLGRRSRVHQFEVSRGRDDAKARGK